MKKITFLLLFLIACASGNYAQCVNSVLYPPETIVSDNSGDPQLINSCVYTGHFSNVSNLTIGSEYTFDLTSNDVPVSKFITITDVSNNPIAYGVTPLVVNGISSTTVHVHYSEDASCGTQEWCLSAYVKATLSCPFPTNIQISGITTTGASFAWTNGGVEQNWQVLILPKGSTAPTSATNGSPVNGQPAYTVTNLEAAHQYQFYIRSDCGSEYSPWRGPFNFNSGCDPIATFSENFDSVSNNELPSCWTALKVNASPNATIDINSLSNSSPNAVQIANDNSGPNAQLLLISPNLSTVATATHRLKFYTRGYGPVSLEVGTVNTTTADGVFTPIETINATANYTEHTVSFTNYVGTDTYVAFRHANTSTYNPVFLDDIRWEISPLCPDVQNIEATALTQTTATVSWQPGGSETQWDVVYSETGADPNILTPISPAPTITEATITGLQPNKTYKVWVRSSCSGSLGNGAWMNPISITTPCAATALLNETFESTTNGNLPECWSAIIAGSSAINGTVKVVTSNGANGSSNAVQLFDGDGGSNPKIILVSPNLTTVTTGTHRVKFFAKSNSPAAFEVGTVSSPASGTTFTAFQTINITPSYNEYVVDFTGYTGSDNYIAFRHASGQYVTIYLDNIRWEPTPLCNDVTEVSINNETETSAALHWTANGGETNWDVVYGTEGVTDPNTLTPIDPAPTLTPAITLNSLSANTTYNVWVRSVCGGAQGKGAWIGPLKFKTACSSIGSFSEGFETTAYGDLPNCWSRILAGPTLSEYAAVRTVTNDSASGNNAVEINASSSASTDFIMLVSPYLNNLSAGTHRLKFHVLSYNDSTPFEIGTLNGNNSQATYTTFQSFTLGTGYNELVVDFSSYSGTDTYIAFRNVAGNYNSTFVDNIRWEINPSCPDVNNLEYSDVGTGTATVTWSSSGSETNWQVAYGPESVTDPSTLTPSGILTQTSDNITGLSDNTFYNVWVRSVCGGPNGNGAWIGPITFKTLCLPTVIPYTQDFESAIIPNLPDCSTLEKVGSSNDWETTWGDSGYGFDGQVLRYQANSSNANAWYFTQGVHLIGGTTYVISYKYGNNSSDNYIESLQVSYGLAANISSMNAEIADHFQINTGMAAINEVTFTPAETGDYYFGFFAYSQANQGDLYLDNISISPSLSVPETSLDNISYYPNPVKDRLHILSPKDITHITVVNLLGQKVLENNFNSSAIDVDMSGLPSGNYIIKLMTDNVVKTIKIIKQ